MTSEEIKAAAECIENGSGDMRKQNPNAEFTSYPDNYQLGYWPASSNGDEIIFDSGICERVY